MLLIVCTCCVTVKMPRYLKDDHPYKKQYESGFDQVMTAATQALKDLGWAVSGTADPSVFEQSQVDSSKKVKQILLFTEMRQASLVLPWRYMSLNVYVFEADRGAGVEIRYASVLSVLFFNMKSYQNDDAVNKVFKRISELLKK